MISTCFWTLPEWAIQVTQSCEFCIDNTVDMHRIWQFPKSILYDSLVSHYLLHADQETWLGFLIYVYSTVLTTRSCNSPNNVHVVFHKLWILSWFSIDNIHRIQLLSNYSFRSKGCICCETTNCWVIVWEAFFMTFQCQIRSHHYFSITPKTGQDEQLTPIITNIERVARFTCRPSD